ncbi:GMP reductase [Acetobacter ascendens]|uniref:GMP reductase n=1 Tax=Acetobacter ascendens TaxID=481146 RepID=UPI000875E915|nr:GMP reductase [Acetobacter ascendens]AOW48762.1 GMP reductase [Acetobacter ascendens]
MTGTRQTDPMQWVHMVPELAFLADSSPVIGKAEQSNPFVCEQHSGVWTPVFGKPFLENEETASFYGRMALEMAFLLNGLPAQDVKKYLNCIWVACARSAARWWKASGGAVESCPEVWVEALAADRLPEMEWLQKLCQQQLSSVLLSANDQQVFSVQTENDNDFCQWVQRAWPYLGSSDVLMAEGGDERLGLNPQTHQNRYGCTYSPSVTGGQYSSSTASSPSLHAYNAVEQQRLELVRDMLVQSPEGALLALEADIKAFLAQYYGVEKPDNCILAPSGTDSVLAALALSLVVNPAVGVILAGVEETGSGVPLATQGRHFANTTALGFRVRKSEKIAGFPVSTQLVTAPLRTENGELNSRQNIFHICQQQIHKATQAGQRVLLYLLDTSKTGQLVPDMQVVQALCHTYLGQIDVVVDACQARLMPERIKAYLQQDWAVMVTGSKFYTGPAFCGALLLPETWRQRLDHAVLPSGLVAYFNQAEWPACKATAFLNNEFNLGLLLRWVGACAEIKRFSDVPASEKIGRLEQFLGGIRHILEQDQTIELLPDTLEKRDALPNAWDQQQTIFSFLIHGGGNSDMTPVLNLAECRQLHVWLKQDISGYLPFGCPDTAHQIMARSYQLGQPVAVPYARVRGQMAGALRISVSARHISGSDMPAGMAYQTYLEQEIQNVQYALEKVSLILRYWPFLHKAEEKVASAQSESLVDVEAEALLPVAL